MKSLNELIDAINTQTTDERMVLALKEAIALNDYLLNEFRGLRAEAYTFLKDQESHVFALRTAGRCGLMMEEKNSWGAKARCEKIRAILEGRGE